jgi:hypothetical protein
MWERGSDKDHCRQDMGISLSCAFRPSCDLFVSSFLYFHVAWFFVVKRTESVIDATVAIHSEPDMLRNVGGRSFGTVGSLLQLRDHFVSNEMKEY